MTLWGIGFAIWQVWQYARLGLPGVALAGLVLFAQGPTLLFWLLAGGTALVLLGARLVLKDLAQRERADDSSVLTAHARTRKR